LERAHDGVLKQHIFFVIFPRRFTLYLTAKIVDCQAELVSRRKNKRLASIIQILFSGKYETRFSRAIFPKRATHKVKAAGTGGLTGE
jgi:hypothetical protein